MIKNLQKLGSTAKNAGKETKESFEKTAPGLNQFGNAANVAGKRAKESLQEITPELRELYAQTERLAQHWGVSFKQALPLSKKLGTGFKETTKDTYQLAQAADFVSKKHKLLLENHIMP